MVQVHVYGVFLLAPVAIATLWLSVSTSLSALALPFLALGAGCVFLPWGLGNSCISGLVRRNLQPGSSEGQAFIVQLTFTPRLRDGLRGALEDADDVGWLSFHGSELRFDGDSVELRLPRESVTALRRENVGLRTLFVYGPKLSLQVKGLEQVEAVEFVERSSLLLHRSRQTARELKDRVAVWLSGAS